MANVIGNDYVAQTPAGSTPAGTGQVAPTVNYTPPTGSVAGQVVPGTVNYTNPTGSTAGNVTASTVDWTGQPVTQALPSTQSGGVVQNYLNDLLSQDSAYMRNAAQTGLNQASARGLRNSSIAAGSAQQAAIEGSMPILNQIMGLNNQREAQAFQGEQAGFDRDLTVAQQNATLAQQAASQNAQQAFQAQQSEYDRGLTVAQQNAQLAQQAALQNAQNQFTAQQSQNDRDLTVAQQNANMALQTQQQNAQQAYQAEQAALDRTQGVNKQILDAELASRQAAQDYQFKSWLQDAGVKQQDWLNSQQYDREFSGALSQMQINTAADLYKQILSASLNDPEAYPADVTAGMQNFFTGNWGAIMQKYFPSTVRS